MLSIREYLPFLKLCVWLTGLSGSNYLEWNEGLGRFKGRTLTSFQRLFPQLLISFQALVVSYRMGTILTEPNALLHNVTSILLFTGTIAAWGMGVIGFRKAKQIAHFFNTLIKMEETGPKKHLKLKKSVGGLREKLGWVLEDVLNRNPGRLILASSAFCQVSCPGLVMALLMQSPCSFPVFLRSTLNDCPIRGNLPSLPQSLALPFILLDVFFIYYTWGQGCVAIGSTFYLSVLCVADHLRR
jgi:hypothetical protein